MNELIFEVATLLFTILLVTVVFAFTPYYIRKTDAFGVSVPEEQYHHPKLVAMRAGFRNTVLLLGLAVTVLCVGVMLIAPRLLVIAYSVLLFGQLAAIFLIFYRYHKQAKALKAAEGWERSVVSKVAVELGRVVRVSPLWTLFYLLPIFPTVAMTVEAYPSLPERIPMNYNLTGEVTSFAAKSWRAVMLLPGTQLMMAILFAFVLLSISRSRMTIDPQAEEESLHRGNAFRLAWSLFMLVGGFGMICMFMLMQMAVLGKLSMQLVTPISLVIPLLFISAAIVLSFKLGQGGSRLKTKASKAAPLTVRDDDRYWKLGSFYYNPDDPAVFVEKRFGIGWTCNFARPATYLFLLGLVAFVVLSFLMIPPAV